MRRISGNLTVVGLAVLMAVTASTPADAAVSVKRGKQLGQRIFPDNAFSVRDRNQVTGRRVRFRMGVDYPTVGGTVRRKCTATTYSICDGFAQLNTLDGFDLQPRVTVPFTGAIDLASVNDRNFFITTGIGKAQFVSGLRQLTFDPATQHARRDQRQVPQRTHATAST